MGRWRAGSVELGIIVTKDCDCYRVPNRRPRADWGLMARPIPMRLELRCAYNTSY